MIRIRNIEPIGKPIPGVCQYEVGINNNKPIAHFTHRRIDGLAECLRRAADAVDMAQKDEAVE